MTEKLYDSVIIASDKNGVNKLRYCNNLNKRLEVLKRDNFTVHETIVLPRHMTKREIVDTLLTMQHERLCDSDRTAVENAMKVLKRKNVRITTFEDVAKNILLRKEQANDGNTQTV